MRQDTLPFPPEPGEPAGQREEALASIRDRRRSPRRRLRDRIASLERIDNPALRAMPRVGTQVLLVDDDLRQTALSLGAVEAFLAASMALLEKPGLTADELHEHADDDAVLDRLEVLSENVATLRRRMLSIANAMK
jgi:hypothetical protein